MSLHRPTVHDLSSLSLHPTGARAKREETNVVQDARGNLIAKDAAGWSRVVRRRREKEEEEEEEEEKEMMVKGKAKDISPDDYLEMYVNQPKGMRAHKRRRIAHDVDFLQSRENDGNNLDLPAPSSVSICPLSLLHKTYSLVQDLLKQIHHFASHYYAAHDLLFDSKREYRKARKEKKDKKKKKAKPREQGREREEEENTDIEEDTDSVDEAESGKEDEGSEDGEEEDKSKPQPKRRAKKGEKKTLQRNMYKVFDGSALMTLGAS